MNHPTNTLRQYFWALLICAIASPAFDSAALAQDEDLSFKRLTSSEYQAKFNKHGPQGYYAVDVNVQVENGAALFDLRMQKPSAAYQYAAHHNLSDKQYQEKQELYADRGMAVRVHHAYVIRGRTNHVAIWNPVPVKNLVVWKQGDVVPQSSTAARDRVSEVDSMVKQFMVKHQVPGVSIAIAKNGRMLYSQGYGYSNVEARKQTTTKTQFRIASISKPLTSVAIFRLVQEGKLSLATKIADVLPHRPYDSRTELDPRWKDITILHLLQHSGGFDRSVSSDPMFMDRRISTALSVPSPPGTDNIIRYMLTTKLDFTPGTKYAYSNFGYCMLGRVIEQVTKQSYEDYVRSMVLKPMKANEARLGRTRLQHVFDTETTYYQHRDRLVRSVFDGEQSRVTSPYGGWHLEAMDSHGGWISNSEDLVRFASNLVGRKSVLSADSLKTMYAWPGEQLAANRSYFYACGWSVRPRANGTRNAWHSGALPGTSSILVQRHDGYVWAVLFNKRKGLENKELASLIDSQVHRAVDSVRRWR